MTAGAGDTRITLMPANRIIGMTEIGATKMADARFGQRQLIIRPYLEKSCMHILESNMPS
jgi:hypothetical protein